MADGNMVEVGTVGNEGMTCLNAVLDGRIATTNVVCQIPGLALRMEVGNFQWEAESNPRFRVVLDLYSQAYLAQVEQSVAFNKLHSL